MSLSPVERSTIKHLLSINNQWYLINEGVTDLTESFNPETDDLQYIAEDNKTHIVKTYAPSISLSAVITDTKTIEDPVNTWMQDIINKLPIMGNANTAYIRFNILDKVGNANEMQYKAYKRDAVVEATSIGGAAGDNVNMEVTISGRGSAKEGVVTITKNGDIITYEFTEGAISTNKSIKFTVTSGGSVIKDASVKFNNNTKLTGTDGIATFSIDNLGTYEYSVAKEGKEGILSNVTIDSTSPDIKEIAVSLQNSASSLSDYSM